MAVKDIKTLTSFCLVGMLSGVGIGIWFGSSHTSPWGHENYRRLNTALMPYTMETMIPISSGNSQYSLVEFLDYECPACRIAESNVQVAVRMPEVKCGRYIAHLPLDIHNQAMTATSAMLAASEFGLGTDLHQRLMRNGNLCLDNALAEAAVENLAFSKVITMSRSAKFLRLAKSCRDEAVAVGLDETPSYCVLTPKGALLRFSSLSSALGFIKDAVHRPSFPWDP
jgi:hypothetical protein